MKNATCKLIADAADLRRAVTWVSRTIERRNNTPILGAALFRWDGKALNIAGTNLDIELCETIPARGPRSRAAVALPPGAILPALKDVSGEVEIWLHTVNGDPELVEIIADEMTVRVRSIFLLAEDWPSIEFEAERAQNMDEAALHDALRVTIPCISKEKTRHYLNGVYFHEKKKGRGRAVSADGHRMTVHELAGAWGCHHLIVPTQVVNVLHGTLRAGGNRQVRIETRETKIRVTLEDRTITAKTIDGTFPDYERLFPKEDDRFGTIDCTLSHDLMRRIPSVNGSSVPVEIDPEGGQITCELLSPWVMEITIPFSGKGPKIGLDSRYLKELLRVSGALRMRGTGPRDPVVLLPETPDTRFILMPMRV